MARTRTGQALSRYTFADLELDAETGVLSGPGGVTTQLQPKCHALLALLIERPRAVWSHDELRERLWPDVTVEEGSLGKVASRLRQALGPELLETLPRRGYRLNAEVSRVADAPEPPRASLIGREALIERLVQALGEGRLVALRGSAGMGKSSVARAVASRLGGLELSVNERGLLGALARSFEVPLDGASPDDLELALRACGPRLICVDDLHLDPAGAALIARWSEAVPRVCWLVTSHGRPALEAEHLELSPLTIEQGALLLSRRSGVEPDPSDARVAALVRALDGNPLALGLAAARLRIYELDQLAELLPDRLALLQDGEASLASALAAAWSALPAEDRAALGALCSVRAAVPSGAFGALLDRPDPYDRHERLQRLVDAGWALCTRQEGTTWISVGHNARAWIEAQEPARVEARHRLAAWLVRQGLQRLQARERGDPAATAWLLAHEEIAEALVRAGSPAECTGPLVRMLVVAAHYQQGLERLEATLACVPPLQGPDQVMLDLERAYLLFRHERHAEAANVHRALIERARQLPAEHRGDLLAEAWIGLTWSLLRLQDPGAQQAAEQAVAEAHTAGARSLACLAAYRATEQIVWVERAAEGLAPESSQYQNVRAALGAALLGDGRLEEARAVMLEWLAEGRTLMTSQRVMGLGNLGTILLLLGEHAEGDRILLEGIDAARRGGTPRAWVHLVVNRVRGLLAAGRCDEAEAAIAEVGAATLPAPCRAELDLARALLAMRRGDWARALVRLQTAEQHVFSAALSVITLAALSRREQALARLAEMQSLSTLFEEDRIAARLAEAWLLPDDEATALWAQLRASPSPGVAPPNQRLPEFAWLAGARR